MRASRRPHARNRVPRTATVSAKTPLKLLALDRAPFLEAVTGHPQTHARARAIVEERLPEEREEA